MTSLGEDELALVALGANKHDVRFLLPPKDGDGDDVFFFPKSDLFLVENRHGSSSVAKLWDFCVFPFPDPMNLFVP